MQIKINYDTKIICFLDILGFEQIVNDSTSRDLSIQNTALGKLNIIYEIYNTHEFTQFDTPTITQFSDSIVISIQFIQEDAVFFFLLRLKMLIQKLAEKQILCRGGISVGNLYHKDQTICGPALIEAYKLESKIANYPRVILHQEILEIAKRYKGAQNTIKQVELYLMDIVGYDSDGFYYIDYLNNIETEHGTEKEITDYFSKIRDMVEQFICHKDINLRSKYVWLRVKYNEAVNNLSKKRELEIQKIAECSNNFL